RHDGRDVRDEFVNVEQHELRVAVLLLDAIHPRPDLQIVRIPDLVASDDARTHRREAVLSLRDDPLTGPPAIARRNVIDDGIAKYIVESVRLCDIPRGLTYHDSKLCLPIELLRHFCVVPDRVVPCDDRGRRLGKDYWLLREFVRRIERPCGF